MKEHYTTSAARASLAARFDLPYSEQMQDWEYEVADHVRFGEFLSVHRSVNLSKDERFSLMEMLVQCVEEIETPADHEAAWLDIEPLLSASPEIHLCTVVYWAQPASGRAKGRSAPLAPPLISSSQHIS